MERSPSLSLSAYSLGEDDDLPDIRGTTFGASVSSLAFLGGGGENAPGPAIAHPGSEADTPKARALGKRAVSPVGSTVEVEQAMAGAMQPPPQRVEGAPESGTGGHGGRASAATTAIAEDEGHSAEAVVSPLEVIALSMSVASPAHPLVIC